MSEPLTLAFALRAVEIHLTFATLVTLAAWAVTSARQASATTRYWIWVATSLNFVLPIGVFVDRLRPPNLDWVLPLEDLGGRILRGRTVGAALAVVWTIGAALMLARLAWRIRAGRDADGATAARSGTARHSSIRST